MAERYVDIYAGILDLRGIQCVFSEERKAGDWWRKRYHPTLVVCYQDSDDECEFWFMDASTRDDAHQRLVTALNTYNANGNHSALSNDES